MANKVNADVIFGTDPDCDRIGVVVKDNKGEFRVLTGNQTGMLLVNYVLGSLKANTTSKINLPKSNVLKYILEDDSWFVVRPSGTEPKMKVYLAVKGNSLEDADKQTERFKSSVMAIVNEKLN